MSPACLSIACSNPFFLRYFIISFGVIGIFCISFPYHIYNNITYFYVSRYLHLFLRIIYVLVNMTFLILSHHFSNFVIIRITKTMQSQITTTPSQLFPPSAAPILPLPSSPAFRRTQSKRMPLSQVRSAYQQAPPHSPVLPAAHGSSKARTRR